MGRLIMTGLSSFFQGVELGGLPILVHTHISPEMLSITVINHISGMEMNGANVAKSEPNRDY